MKLAVTFFATLFSGFSLLSTAPAQTPSPEPSKSFELPQLEALAKKIDEQNAKIDALSQEILKLEQQIAHIRPCVMVGENTPSPSTPAVQAAPRFQVNSAHTAVHIFRRRRAIHRACRVL